MIPIQLKYIAVSLLLLLLVACSEQSALNETIKAYYEHYNERTNYEGFMDFYTDSVILEDMVSGEQIKGIKALQAFLDWTNPEYSKLDQNTLIIEEQIIENNRVVTQGYFTPFKWGDTTFEAMQFTSILTFNKDGKIVKQVDWINYPNNLLNYDKRLNSNDWINPK